jgi:hypothetical protein
MPLGNPLRLGTGRLPAEIHRTHTLDRLPRTCLLVGPTSPMTERFELLAYTVSERAAEKKRNETSSD